MNIDSRILDGWADYDLSEQGALQLLVALEPGWIQNIQNRIFPKPYRPSMDHASISLHVTSNGTTSVIRLDARRLTGVDGKSSTKGSPGRKIHLEGMYDTPSSGKAVKKGQQEMSGHSMAEIIDLCDSESDDDNGSEEELPLPPPPKPEIPPVFDDLGYLKGPPLKWVKIPPEEVDNLDIMIPEARFAEASNPKSSPPHPRPRKTASVRSPRQTGPREAIQQPDKIKKASGNAFRDTPSSDPCAQPPAAAVKTQQATESITKTLQPRSIIPRSPTLPSTPTTAHKPDAPTAVQSTSTAISSPSARQSSHPQPPNASSVPSGGSNQPSNESNTASRPVSSVLGAATGTPTSAATHTMSKTALHDDANQQMHSGSEPRKPPTMQNPSQQGEQGRKGTQGQVNKSEMSTKSALPEQSTAHATQTHRSNLPSRALKTSKNEGSMTTTCPTTSPGMLSSDMPSTTTNTSASTVATSDIVRTSKRPSSPAPDCPAAKRTNVPVATTVTSVGQLSRKPLPPQSTQMQHHHRWPERCTQCDTAYLPCYLLIDAKMLCRNNPLDYRKQLMDRFSRSVVDLEISTCPCLADAAPFDHSDLARHIMVYRETLDPHLCYSKCDRLLDYLRGVAGHPLLDSRNSSGGSSGGTNPNIGIARPQYIPTVTTSASPSGYSIDSATNPPKATTADAPSPNKGPRATATSVPKAPAAQSVSSNQAAEKIPMTTVTQGNDSTSSVTTPSRPVTAEATSSNNGPRAMTATVPAPFTAQTVSSRKTPETSSADRVAPARCRPSGHSKIMHDGGLQEWLEEVEGQRKEAEELIGKLRRILSQPDPRSIAK